WLDGGRLQIAAVDPSKKGRPETGWYTLDPGTGKLSGPAAKPEGAEAPPTLAPAPFRLRQGQANVQAEQVIRRVRPLWLEAVDATEQRLALVSADSPRGALSPRNDAVLYFSEGAAWVRPLVRMDRAVFEAARDAARRAVLSSNMK